MKSVQSVGELRFIGLFKDRGGNLLFVLHIVMRLTRLGRKPYEVPAKVPRVSSDVKEWKSHPYHHLGVIHNLRQEGCHYGISWEGSNSFSNESTSSSGSRTSGSDSLSIFSWKAGSLLESE